jgi:hypothetical protein
MATEDAVIRYAPEEEGSSSEDERPPDAVSSCSSDDLGGQRGKSPPEQTGHVCGMFCAYSPAVQEKRRLLYDIFEEPESSVFGYALAICILGLIILSILSLVIETEDVITRHLPERLFPLVEAISTLIFSLELCVRFSVCDVRGSSGLKFISNWGNIFDFLAIVPWYVESITASMLGPGTGQQVAFLRVLRIFRLARVTRLSKQIRESAGMQVFGAGLRRSRQPLILLFILLMLGVIFYSALMYYIEGGLCVRNSARTQCGVGVDLESLATQTYWLGEHHNLRLCEAGLPLLLALDSSVLDLGSSFAEALGIAEVGPWSDELTPELCTQARVLACAYGDTFPVGNGDVPYYAACAMGVGTVAFPSIASSFWWSFVTMCTVGYGDLYPTTGFGRIVAFFTMWTGVLLIALPMAIVGTEFLDAGVALESYLLERERKNFRRQTLVQYKRASERAFKALGFPKPAGSRPWSSEGADPGPFAFEPLDAKPPGTLRENVRLEEDPRPPGSAAPLLPLGTEGVAESGPTPPRRAWGTNQLGPTTKQLHVRFKDMEKKITRVEELNKRGLHLIRAYGSLAREFGMEMRSFGADLLDDATGNTGLGNLL